MVQLSHCLFVLGCVRVFFSVKNHMFIFCTISATVQFILFAIYQLFHQQPLVQLCTTYIVKIYYYCAHNEVGPCSPSLRMLDMFPCHTIDMSGKFRGHICNITPTKIASSNRLSQIYGHSLAMSKPNNSQEERHTGR